MAIILPDFAFEATLKPKALLSRQNAKFLGMKQLLLTSLLAILISSNTSAFSFWWFNGNQQTHIEDCCQINQAEEQTTDAEPGNTETLADPNFAISVYPNPSTNWINIELDHGLTAKTIEIYDVVGQLVAKEYNGPISESTSFDISLLNEGLYFATVIGPKEDWVVTKMFSKVN